MFLSSALSIDFSKLLTPGKVVVFLEPPSSRNGDMLTKLDDYIGPHTVIRYEHVDDEANDPEYMVIENPYPDANPPKDETNPYIEGKLVIAQESELTDLTYSFETSNNPTAPGPPSPPWAMLASDNVMTLTFVPSSDTGGAPVSHYQLVMRDAQKKGLFVTVFDGPIDTGTKAIPIAPQIEVGQRQFTGIQENKAYQLKVRAKNDAGWGEWSPIGIDQTTNLCDLVFSCAGGNAILLDWSSCKQSNGVAGLVYRLVELEYPEALRSREIDVDDVSSEVFQAPKVIYEGKALRFTRWDLEDQPVVRRYRIHIMKRLPSGALKPMSIYSSYLRTGNVAGVQLQHSLVHKPGGPSSGTRADLLCKSPVETIGSGTYSTNKVREWIIAPATDGGTSIEHGGVYLHFTRFDLECDTDLLTVRLRGKNCNAQLSEGACSRKPGCSWSDNGVGDQCKAGIDLWKGGCYRNQPFHVFTRATDVDVVLRLQSDSSFSGRGFDVKYVAVPKTFDIDNDSRDVSAAIAAAQQANANSENRPQFGLDEVVMLEARKIPTKLFTNQSTVSRQGCPSREGAVCSGHGTCGARIATTVTVLESGESVASSTVKDWQCQCDGLFFGESCAHEAFCEKTEADAVLSERNKEFVASICNNSHHTYAVWPFGRDEVGVGGTGQLGSGTTTNPKPVRSISRALELAADGLRRAGAGSGGGGGGRRRRLLGGTTDVGLAQVVMLPGNYKGFDVCNVTVIASEKSGQGVSQIRIGTTRGEAETVVDCERTGRFLTVQGSQAHGIEVEIMGLTVKMGAGTGTGGSLLHIDSGRNSLGDPAATQTSFIGSSITIANSVGSQGIVARGAHTTLDLSNCRIQDHSFGAILVEEGASFKAVSARFNNNAAEHGSCILAMGENTQVNLFEIVAESVQAVADNRPEGYRTTGGFMSVDAHARVSIAKARIQDASCPGGVGGVISARGGSSVNVSELDTLRSDADVGGGVIFAEGAGTHVHVQNITVVTSRSMRGGVIAASNGSRVVIVGATNLAKDVTADTYGGYAFADFGATVEVTGLTLNGSFAGKSGGLVWAGGGSSMTISDSQAKRIRAGQFGGAFYVEGVTDTGTNAKKYRTRVHVESSQFDDLKAGYMGGGLYIAEGGAVTMRENIFTELRLACGDHFASESNTQTKTLGGGLNALAAAGSAIIGETDAALAASTGKDTMLLNPDWCAGAGAFLETESKLLGENTDGPRSAPSNMFVNLKADRGAGLALSGKAIEVTGLIFQDVSAVKGSAIMMLSRNSADSMLLSSLPIVEPTDATGGGGGSNTSNHRKNGTTIDTQAILTSIHIIRANASTAGAVIYSNGGKNSTLKVIDMHVSHVIGRSQPGAAIFLDAGASVSVTSFDFKNISSDQSGGLAYITGASSLSFHEGIAERITSLADGGAFLLDGASTVTLTNSTFRDCAATGHGGFAYMTAGAVLSLQYALVASTNTKKNGGFAYMTGTSVLRLQQTELKTAQARLGGALYMEAGSRVDGDGKSKIVDTFASENGGGVYADDESHTHLSGFTIEDARATMGAGVYISNGKCSAHNVHVVRGAAFASGGGYFAKNARLNISQGSVSTCSAGRGSGGVGGGIMATDASLLTTAGFVVSNSTADKGGGLAVQQNSKAFVASQTRISHCSAKVGAGIFLQSSECHVTERSIVSDCAAVDGGGGVYVFDGSFANISETSILHNVAYYGGGIHTESCPVYIRKSNISQNSVHSGGYGGAFYLSKKAFGLVDDNSYVNENRATKGGAVYIEKQSLFHLKRSTLSRNQAQYDAGGAYVNSAVMLFEDATVSLNMAYDEGGAVNVQNGGNMTCDRTVFEKNSVGGPEDTGAGIGSIVAFGRSTFGHLRSSKFEGNMALFSGGVFATEAELEISDCAFDGNRAQEGAGLLLDRTTRATVSGSTWTKNEASIMGAGISIRGEVVAHFSDCTIGPGNVAGGEAYSALSEAAQKTEAQIGSQDGSPTAETLTGKDVKNAAVAGALDEAEATLKETQGQGAGVQMDKLSRTVFANTRFLKNTALRGFGGAVNMRGKSRARFLSGSVFESNEAMEGAGLWVGDQAGADIQDTQFEKNKATEYCEGGCKDGQIGDGGGGGGVYLTHINCPAEDSLVVSKGAGSLSSQDKVAKPIDIAISLSKEDFTPIPNNAPFRVCIFMENNRFYENVASGGGGLFWRYRNATIGGPLSMPDSWDFQCERCDFGESKNGFKILRPNTPTGASTNAMGARVLFYPEPPRQVETGMVLMGRGNEYHHTISVEVTDRYGARSSMDKTTKCDIMKDPAEVNDLGVDDGSAVSSRGVVQFDGISFLGEGDTTYKTVLSCLIDNRIQMTYKTQIRVGWCQPGFAPVARVCRPCQDRQYSLFGQSCLECPSGGNCTSFIRTADGLPMGVGEPRALPGYWLFSAPKDGYESRCKAGWLEESCATDKKGRRRCPCTPAEKLVGESQVCVDRKWPAFQVHMCLTSVLFYRCPRGASSCPGNMSMSQITLGSNYTSGDVDPQCNEGYGNVICGNCRLGYYSAVADECTKCMGTREDQVQTKLFYAGLSMMAMSMFFGFIFFYLRDGIVVGKKWHAQVGPMSRCQRCKAKCGSAFKASISQGFKIEKFKIALGLMQVFSSFKATYEIKWPPEVIEWFNQFAIFENLDILKLVAMDCLFKTDYLFSLKFLTLSPLVLVFVCFVIWLRGKNTYAKRLALYPRVCSECHQPIDMYEKSPYHRAVLFHMSKQSYCQRLKLKRQLWWRQCRNKGMPVLTRDELKAVGITRVPPRFDCDAPIVKKKTTCKECCAGCLKTAGACCRNVCGCLKFVVVTVLCLKKCCKQVARKKKKAKDNASGGGSTKIRPTGHGKVHKSLTRRETELKVADDESGSSKAISTELWGGGAEEGKKKRAQPKLRKKTSLENNFGQFHHCQVHRFGCKKKGHEDYIADHDEIPVFNFRMRVILRMQFRNFKSRCLKLLFWILLIVYPSVSRKILMLYKCVQIGERSYMMWDTQVQCYTNTWYAHSIYALAFGCLYILGVPGMFFGLLYQSRYYDIDAKWKHIKSSPTRLVKTLKLAREDYWNKGRHWSQILHAAEEERRVRWYLANLNMRSPKTMMRIGFMYKSFLEDFWAFELFEFFFKLTMTGVMVHIRPGTVTQIIAGLTMCFVAFTMHLAFQPYNDASNNVLMGAGKMQLFLTLLLALLLKMEAPFFSGNDQMDEADLSSLANIIIGSSALLVVAWVFSVFYDIIGAKRKKKAAKKLEDERRARRQRFKKTTNLLKAATMKNKIFGLASGGDGGAPKQTTVFGRRQGKMAKKRTIAKQKQAEAIAQASRNQMTQSNTLQAMGFGGGSSKKKSAVTSANRLKRRSTAKQQQQQQQQQQQENEANTGAAQQVVAAGKSEGEGPNYYDSSLQQKSESALLTEVRKDFGAGSQVYVTVMGMIQDVQKGKVTPAVAAQMAEITLKACEPRVPKGKIARYCELLTRIDNGKGQAGLSSAAESFLPTDGD